MGIDGAVPSYQLLLACRDKDAELSMGICQSLSLSNPSHPLEQFSL